MILVPLFDLKFLTEPRRDCCRNFKSAALAQVRRARQHLADLDHDAVAADDHGALGDGKVVGENLDLVVLAGVELDDGATAEPEHLVHRHGGGAEHDGDVECDLVDGCHGMPRTDETLGFKSPRDGYE